MQTTQAFEKLEGRNTRLCKSKTAPSESVLQHKIDIALDLIEKCIYSSISPITLCSFGKDSLVMIHLILQVKKTPIIYWREPFFQDKFEHPQKIAQEWDLEVYDYPPTFADSLQLDDYFDVYNFYYAGGNSFINLYTGTKNYLSNDKKFLCAIKDFLLRPKCSGYGFRWDLIFHGHKQIDPLYIGDKIELKKVALFGNGIMALPIKDWLDEDIWAYIKKYNLPYNKKRYDDKNEKFNNDLFPTCHDCLDYRNIGKELVCPKTGKEVKCIAKTKEENETFRDYLMEVSYK